MHVAEHARRRIKDRGPRWAVIGTIRPGEAETMYAVTADRAEAVREQFEGMGRYQIQVYPPDGSVGLHSLADRRRGARAVLDDVTQQLQAAVIHAVNAEGRAEAEVARDAGVDRMTVRSWLGK